MLDHYLQVKRNKALMIYVLMHGNHMTKIEIQLMKINIKCSIVMKMSKLLKMIRIADVTRWFCVFATEDLYEAWGKKKKA